MTGSDEPVLCVDLDGTLVRTDTLIETFIATVRQRPSTLVRLPAYALRGRAFLKRALAETGSVDPALLPYNRELLAYLQRCREAGRRLVLVTASDASVANRIAEHLGLFDEVIASDGRTNLKGEAKGLELARRYGERGFDYAGDHRSDLKVWKRARGAILVASDSRLERSLPAHVEVLARFPGIRGEVRNYLRACRMYQWLKNLLVFVPLLAANALHDPLAWIQACSMFVAFSLAASGVYLLNDLMDVASDRRHPRKRHRPLASGTLPLSYAAASGPMLLVGGVVVAWSVAADAGLVLLGYVLLTTSYSVRLKALPLVDVFCLAALYTLRVAGGGIATRHLPSIWLLAFSGFLFLALALVKRNAELRDRFARGDGADSSRGYASGDLGILQAMGVSSSMAACVVLSLYVNSEAALTGYSRPALLYGLVPLLLFWQLRLWLSTSRGYMTDDPIVYSTHDWVSWIVLACTVAVIMLARMT